MDKKGLSSEHQTPTLQQALNFALQHHTTGDLQKAEAIYEQIIQTNPDHPIALHLLGVIAHQKGENDRAIDIITKALFIKPDFPEAHCNLGNALKESGKFEDAVIEYNKAISIKPDFAEVYSNLGNAFVELDRLNEAIVNYSKAIEINPEYAEAHTNLGNALKELGNLDEAVISHNRSITIKPDFAEAHYNLGFALQELGWLDEVVASYLKAITNKPDYVEAHCNLGNALHDLGELDEAIASYRKAIELKPDYAEAFNNIRLSLPALCYEIITDDRDTSSIEKIIDTLPTPPEPDIIRLQLKSLTGENIQETWEYVVGHLPTPQSETLQNNNKIGGPSVIVPENYLERRVVALLHFGRSGSGYLHSLLDSHPSVSTLPGVYMSGFFGRQVWKQVSCGGFQELPEQFSALYKVLFDARHPGKIPPAFIGDGYASKSVGVKEGFVEMGPNRDTPLTLDRSQFLENLGEIINGFATINHGQFFEAIHHAYEKTLGNDFSDKKLIFYHLHKIDPYGMANFVKYFPTAQLLMIIRNPVQSCESWIRQLASPEYENAYKAYNDIVSRMNLMLLNLNFPAFRTQDCAAVRLEDIKIKPEATMGRLCDYLGIKETASLYESTMRGLKWWGDPSSRLFGRTHDTESWEDDPIRAETGFLFSPMDQFVLNTLFYPLSARFGYVEQNDVQFRKDLREIRPLLDKPLDFEKRLAERFLPDYPDLQITGVFKSFHAVLIGLWRILDEQGTYPYMIKVLPE